MEVRGPGRRRFVRGGRRTEDQSGYTPLLLLIDPDQDRREVARAILTRQRFAVAATASINEALGVVRGLMPEAVLCPTDDTQQVREALPLDMIPLVAVSDSMARSDQVVEVVRTALRLQPVRR